MAKEKVQTDVKKPNIVVEYNKFMEGVDTADQLIELYRPDIKSRKWYFRIILWAISVAVVNGALLRRRDTEIVKGVKVKKLQKIKFQSSVAHSLCHAASSSRKRGRPSATRNDSPQPLLNKRKKQLFVPEDIRFDGSHHWPETGTSQRCKLCQKVTTITCSKCQKHLCLTNTRNCFKSFHTK